MSLEGTGKEPPSVAELRCCSPDEYQSWRNASFSAKPNPQIGFCEDCTPEFQQSMLAEKKCVRPEIRFFRRVADTFSRKDENGKRIGVFGSMNKPGKGEVYGAYAADNYTFTDIHTGEQKLVSDRPA